MFPLGHIGITAGIIYIMLLIFDSRNKINNPHTPSFKDIDFRLVVILAFLPDIIDKIVGMIILKDEIANGRIFTHSALTIGMLSICIFAVARIKFNRGLWAVFYVIPLWIHLFLDIMWKEPRTLFWPLLGLDFPRYEVEFSDYFTTLLSDPFTIFGEILGGLIIIILIIRHRIYIKMHLVNFLKDGKLRNYPNPR